MSRGQQSHAKAQIGLTMVILPTRHGLDLTRTAAPAMWPPPSIPRRRSALGRLSPRVARRSSSLSRAFAFSDSARSTLARISQPLDERLAGAHGLTTAMRAQGCWRQVRIGTGDAAQIVFARVAGNRASRFEACDCAKRDRSHGEKNWSQLHLLLLAGFGVSIGNSNRAVRGKRAATTQVVFP